MSLAWWIGYIATWMVIMYAVGWILKQTVGRGIQWCVRRVRTYLKPRSE